jgi:hypothetical protein
MFMCTRVTKYTLTHTHTHACTYKHMHTHIPDNFTLESHAVFQSSGNFTVNLRKGFLRRWDHACVRVHVHVVQSHPVT